MEKAKRSPRVFQLCQKVRIASSQYHRSLAASGAGQLFFFAVNGLRGWPHDGHLGGRRPRHGRQHDEEAETGLGRTHVRRAPNWMPALGRPNGTICLSLTWFQRPISMHWWSLALWRILRLPRQGRWEPRYVPLLQNHQGPLRHSGRSTPTMGPRSLKVIGNWHEWPSLYRGRSASTAVALEHRLALLWQNQRLYSKLCVVSRQNYSRAREKWTRYQCHIKIMTKKKNSTTCNNYTILSYLKNHHQILPHSTLTNLTTLTKLTKLVNNGCLLKYSNGDLCEEKKSKKKGSED